MGFPRQTETSSDETDSTVTEAGPTLTPAVQGNMQV